MERPPGTCMMCGCGHTPDNNGVIGPFIDLAIDYNWGDSGYLCIPCATIVGVTAGCATPDTLKDRDRQIAKLEKEMHELQSEMEVRRRREKAAVRRARVLKEAASA